MKAASSRAPHRTTPSIMRLCCEGQPGLRSALSGDTRRGPLKETGPGPAQVEAELLSLEGDDGARSAEAAALLDALAQAALCDAAAAAAAGDAGGVEDGGGAAADYVTAVEWCG